ncbi:YdcF family protein [Cyclobacterium xiamenense]|uniref:YdcF family protein n=1 Tax=Cyclobacterium xiamenense TaxID=1297121 RepID=UPI0012B6D0B9|nr:ElyC/SanA/YdcF family protein [Cyclobacterium xiamenense]
MLLSPPIRYLVEKEEQRFPAWESHRTGAPFILVLGSGGTPDPKLPALQRLSNHSLWRCMQGIGIWRQLPQSFLVLSSAGREGQVAQATFYAQVAREWGVPDSLIREIPSPRTTQEEARDFRAAYPRADSVILVTAALHLPRARTLFEREGLHVIPAPTDYKVKSDVLGSGYFQWIPSLAAASLWQAYLHEKLGTMVVEVKARFHFE